MFWRSRRRARTHPACGLGDGDVLSLDHLFSGVLILGAPSSSKTTAGVGNIARGVLTHPDRPSAVVVPAKASDGPQWECWHRQSGGALPFLKFDRRQRFNWLEYNLTAEGGVTGLLPIFEGMNQLLTRNQPQGTDSYFQAGGLHDLMQAVRACWLGNGTVCVRHVYEFLTSAPANDEDLKDETSFAVQTLLRLREMPETAEGEHCLDYFCSDRPRLGRSERTLACVESVGLNLLRPFLAGIVGETMGGPETTISPERLEDGVVLFLDVPVLTGFIASKLAAAIWLLSVNRYALRRKAGRPIIVFADEYPQTAVQGEDVRIAAVGRSHKLGRVLVAQNLPQLEAALGSGEAGRQEAHALIACMGHIFGFANACHATDKHLSEILGSEPQMLFGGSTETGGEPFDMAGWMIGSWAPKAHCSFSQHLQPVLPPQTFLTLATGGKLNGFVAEAIVIAANRTFADGRPWKRIALNQVLT